MQQPSAMPPSKPQPDVKPQTGAAGAVAATSGLDQLLERLRSAGLGDQVNSWLSDGPNKSIDPQQVTQAVGTDQMAQFAKTAGVSPDEVANGLAKALPAVVNEMTPHGQMPTPSEVQSTMNRLIG